MTLTSGPLETLRALEAGATQREALAFFDSLPPVRPAELVGARWHGGEVPTGHRLDGMLSISHWYGKQFDDVNHVHPLLFTDRHGEVFAVDPKLMPLSASEPINAFVSKSTALQKLVSSTFPLLKPLIKTRKHRARLRDVEFRGSVSAAMVYDHLAVIDHFRAVDPNTLLGIMDLRGMAQPYFFTLRRDEPLSD